MTSLPSVAIAGASGNLGKAIATTFLQPEFKSKFQDVILLSRSKSDSIKEMVSMGGQLRLYDDTNITDALQEVDVLINAIGSSGHQFRDKIVSCLPYSPIKIYFPSEFGVDHYEHDFSHKEWDHKKHHFELVRETVPGLKTCRLFAELFLEDAIGPWFGFHTAKERYESVGRTTQRTSYTSKYDVGKSLAILASSPPESLPKQIHLNGDTKSFDEIAEIMEANGSGQIKVESIDLDNFKKEVLSKSSFRADECLRFLMGEGKIDHSTAKMGNNFVNNEEEL